jgi:transcriptional regulator with XRE-family HTH domain
LKDSDTRVIGGVLREIRRRKGWTLREVGERSAGVFKPTALAGYERGERRISLERFSELADLYEVPAARLMAEVARIRKHRLPDVLDLSMIERLEGSIARTVEGFGRQVLSLRDQADLVVRLRAGDLQVLSTALGTREDVLRAFIRGALISAGDSVAADRLRDGTVLA